MKLNLGCGTKHLEGYINIDIQDPCDLKHDMRKPLPFNDNSIDEIFTEGSFITLFSVKEWEKVKKDIVRVIKPGGKLEIECVDFDYIIKAFLDDKNGERWGWWRQTILAGQENEYDFCKNIFTYDKLVSDFQEEGMVNFIRVTKNISDVDIRLICYKNQI